MADENGIAELWELTRQNQNDVTRMFERVDSLKDTIDEVKQSQKESSDRSNTQHIEQTEKLTRIETVLEEIRGSDSRRKDSEDAHALFKQNWKWLLPLVVAALVGAGKQIIDLL